MSIDNSKGKAVVDSDFVRGGGRYVADLTELYALDIKSDQLKENVTEIWVNSLNYKMLLIDIDNIDNSAGWKSELQYLDSVLGLTPLTLVTPAINVAWTLLKNDGVTPYVPSSSSTKNITVDKGTKVQINATFQYPTPNGTTTKGPAGITGSFGTTDPGPATPSANFNNGGVDIVSNTTFNVSLNSPKIGLEVASNKVIKAVGNDVTGDSISASFLDKVFYGTIAKNGGSEPILDSDILALTSVFATSRQRSFTNFGGGGQRILIILPYSFGVPSFKVNGLSNTDFSIVRNNSDFVNHAAFTVKISAYISNNDYNSPLDSFEIL